jgi:multiple sugar transport system permease protein
MIQNNAMHAFVTQRRNRKALIGYLLISPWLIGFLCFTAGPMLASLWLSFTNYSISGAPTFIGLDNYTYMFTRDRLFWGAVQKTLFFAISVVVLGTAASLGCALLLDQKLRGIGLLRTAFFIPSLTPIVAASIIWLWLLQPTYGPVNGVLESLGISGPGWLRSREWAVSGLLIIRLWVIVGGANMLVFLAGLQNVPQELYDAATVDGANAWERFVNITIPMITPTIFFNLIVGVIAALKVFTTWFYLLHLYEAGFRNLEMGYASALAWFFLVVVLAITAFQFSFSRRWVYYEAE